MDQPNLLRIEDLYRFNPGGTIQLQGMEGERYFFTVEGSLQVTCVSPRSGCLQYVPAFRGTLQTGNDTVPMILRWSEFQDGVVVDEEGRYFFFPKS